MATPRHKGKQKQKNKKPAKVVETTAQKVAENEEEKQTPVEEQQPQEQVLSEKEQKKLDKEKAKKDKQIAKDKADKKKQEAREKSGKLTIGQRFKETGSELKKISWPSFKETMKKTGVVIAVVLFFAVCLFAFDYVLSLLHNLLV